MAGNRKLTEPCWEHFHRFDDARYNATLVYAACKHCFPSFPAGVLADVVRTLADDNAVGRIAAKQAHLVIGRKREMARHLKVCPETSHVLKAWAAAHISTSNRKPPLASAAPTSACLPRPPEAHTVSTLGKRRASSMRQGLMTDFAPVEKHQRFNVAEYHRLIAELISVHNVPFAFFSSPEFRRLQAFYIGEGDLTGSPLLITKRKIRNVILPARFEEAVLSIRERIEEGFMRRDGYTIQNDRWISSAKSHVFGVNIASSDSRRQTVGIYPVLPSALHGVAISKSWEKLVILSREDAPVDEYPKGFFARLPGPPTAFCSDSAGANGRARRIASLRHPNLIFVPCYAHQLAQMCGDYLVKCSKASTIVDSLYLTHFFNSSASTWLPILQEEVVKISGKATTLVSAVVTRWTNSWLCAMSVLQCKDAFIRCLTHPLAKSMIAQAERSGAVKFQQLKRVVSIIKSETFWEGLAQYVQLLVPAIEASVLMQGGTCTLADVMYSTGRAFQAMEDAGETQLSAGLEKRFEQYELPLLFLALWLHPRYKSFAMKMLSAGVVEFSDVRSWVDEYLRRWFGDDEEPLDGAMGTLMTALPEWNAGENTWVKQAVAFQKSPRRYWGYILMAFGPFARKRDPRACAVCDLAKLALRIFAVLPNATDPERLFSELGRTVMGPRARLTDGRSSRMLVIAQDVREKESEAALLADLTAEKPPDKRFSEKAQARRHLQALRKISVSEYTALAEREVGTQDGTHDDAQNGAQATAQAEASDSAVSAVTMSVEAGSSLIQARSDEIACAEALDSLRPQQATQICDEQRFVFDKEGMVGDEQLELLTDERVTSTAFESYERFTIGLTAAMETVGWDGDSFGIPDGNGPEDEHAARAASFSKYPLGQLPEFNDESIPQDHVYGKAAFSGFRCTKVKLGKLFDKSVVGILPPICQRQGHCTLAE